jgi:hypothetical protein
MVIIHKSEHFDTDQIERVKCVRYHGEPRAVRIYYADCTTMRSDPDGSLYETFRNNGVYAS